MKNVGVRYSCEDQEDLSERTEVESDQAHNIDLITESRIQ